MQLLTRLARTFGRRLARDSRGQVTVVVGLFAVGLTGTVGLSLDAAAIQRSGVQLQDAADAAALHGIRAGASRRLDDAEIQAAVEQFIQTSYQNSDSSDAYGAATAQVEATVVSRSPTTLKVTATRSVQLPFGFLRGEGGTTVAREATAVEALKAPVTLLLLSEGAQAWRASGNSTVTIDNGVAVVNSRSPQALDGNGGAKIVSTATMIAGPTQNAAQWTPKPKFNSTPIVDPYASKIDWPTAGTCAPTNTFKKKVATINPGTYCGGLTLTTHARVTLTPGVYILTGPLSITSQSRLYAPEGVTIILKSNTSNVHVQAGSELIIKAPTSGKWKDLAVVQAPQPTEVTSTLIGGGDMDLDGVVYLPTQKLVLTGGGAAGINTGKRIVIANRLETQGNGEIYLKGDGEVLSTNLGARLAS